jgi:hypothetical protein
MATQPSNALVAVQTFQPSELAFLTNACPMARNANPKFKDFQNKTANLGDTVGIWIPPDSIAADGLVASFQASTQIEHTLKCDQAANASRAFTNQQYVFNLNANDYLEQFGRADTLAVATKIEISLGKNSDSSVPVMAINSNGQSYATGALHTESGPYRFFGDGVTAINSYQQLEQAFINFTQLGEAQVTKVFLPSKAIPAIIGTGLNQFVPRRNEESAMSWELGEFGGVDYVRSNLLPRHVSGTIGNSSGASQLLTVVSINAAGTEIVCTTPVTTDSEAIFSGDLGVFVDGVSGQPNLRFLTYYGKAETSEPVQIRMTSSEASSGGDITIQVTPALISAPGATQNINAAIAAGMQIKVMPTHRCGLLVNGNAFYLAMPMLPDEVPYPTESKNDEETGLSLRMYYGSRYGENFRGMVTDAIWGSTIVPNRSMRLLFPDNV